MRAGDDDLFADFEALADVDLPISSDSRVCVEQKVLSTQKSLEDVKQNYQINKLQESIADSQSARKMCHSYAGKTFWLVACCLVFWAGLVVCMVVWNICHDRPPLTDQGLITITAGITANIFAAFLGVIKGIFKLNQE